MQINECILVLLGCNVDALLHEGGKAEPDSVYDGEVVGELLLAQVGLHLPLIGREAAHKKEYNAYADNCQQNAHPDLVGEWQREAQHLRFLYTSTLLAKSEK